MSQLYIKEISDLKERYKDKNATCIIGCINNYNYKPCSIGDNKEYVLLDEKKNNDLIQAYIMSIGGPDVILKFKKDKLILFCNAIGINIQDIQLKRDIIQRVREYFNSF